MQNRVVVHYLNHDIRKGYTNNFFPHKRFFHITTDETKEVIQIQIVELKAVYFVKTFEGNPEYEEKNDVGRTGLGKRIKLLFKDGEMLFGYTLGFSQDRMGFNVVPVDPDSNNERIFVNRNAAEEISLVKDISAPEEKVEVIEKEEGGEKGEKGKKGTMLGEIVIISCPSCGAKNRLRTSKIMFEPKCGKCKKSLI